MVNIFLAQILDMGQTVKEPKLSKWVCDRVHLSRTESPGA